eukprot:COSAG02_NODE_64907_length_259_cov_0.650000_1_plen_36_part_10
MRQGDSIRFGTVSGNYEARMVSQYNRLAGTQHTPPK